MSERSLGSRRNFTELVVGQTLGVAVVANLVEVELAGILCVVDVRQVAVDVLDLGQGPQEGVVALRGGD